PKVYHVKVKGKPEPPSLTRLREGLQLKDGRQLAPSKIRPLREGSNSCDEITLTQGKNQQIRKMFETVGHRVLKLRRVAIGFLTRSGLEIGAHRRLTEREVARILRLGRQPD